MGSLTPSQAIEALWHIQVRLSRLVAIAFLWLIGLSAVLVTGLIWIAWGNWNTLVQMTASVPPWLLGSVTVGGIAALAGLMYRVYHWLAKMFLKRYLFDGLNK